MINPAADGDAAKKATSSPSANQERSTRLRIWIVNWTMRGDDLSLGSVREFDRE
jgi:hypothetical protein